MGSPACLHWKHFNAGVACSAATKDASSPQASTQGEPRAITRPQRMKARKLAAAKLDPKRLPRVTWTESSQSCRRLSLSTSEAATSASCALSRRIRRHRDRMPTSAMRLGAGDAQRTLAATWPSISQAYKKARTVQEFLDLGGAKGDLNWDRASGFLTFL